MTRQTLSFLKKRFEEVGISPRKKLGQNFLIDLNLIDVLFDAAKIEKNDVILEVGTGTGSLTSRMSPAAAAVVTVELDPSMYSLASEELEKYENVSMLQFDILKNKNKLNPIVTDAVDDAVAAGEGRVYKLAANLPYCVATPIISNLLARENPPKSMTVTIQKELADRIVARPSTKDYNSLSIWVQSQCRVEIVRIMPPSVFWPRPKVDSAIIHLEVDDQLRGRIHDLAEYHSFVRSMFFHRRKFLRSVLVSAVKGILSKPDVDAILEQQGLSPMLRSENLDVEQMLALSEAVSKACKR